MFKTRMMDPKETVKALTALSKMSELTRPMFTLWSHEGFQELDGTSIFKNSLPVKVLGKKVIATINGETFEIKLDENDLYWIEA